MTPEPLHERDRPRCAEAALAGIRRCQAPIARTARLPTQVVHAPLLERHCCGHLHHLTHKPPAS